VTQGIPRNKFELVKTDEKFKSRNGSGCTAIYKNKYKIKYSQVDPPEEMPSPK
jgi:hypothetical protein